MHTVTASVRPVTVPPVMREGQPLAGQPAVSNPAEAHPADSYMAAINHARLAGNLVESTTRHVLVVLPTEVGYAATRDRMILE